MGPSLYKSALGFAILVLTLALHSCRTCDPLADSSLVGVWTPEPERSELLARDLEPARAAAQGRLLDTTTLSLTLAPNGEFALAILQASEFGIEFVSGCVSPEDGALRLRSNDRKSEGAELAAPGQALAAAVESGACRVTRQADELVLSLDDGSLAVALELVEEPR